AIGRQLGLELAGQSQQVQLKRLNLAPESHPADYFDSEYIVSSKQNYPLLFHNRAATELEAKIQLSRYLSHFRLPDDDNPLGLSFTRGKEGVSLRIIGLSYESARDMAQGLRTEKKLIQLIDNLFEFGAREVEIEM